MLFLQTSIGYKAARFAVSLALAMCECASERSCLFIHSFLNCMASSKFRYMYTIWVAPHMNIPHNGWLV